MLTTDAMLTKTVQQLVCFSVQSVVPLKHDGIILPVGTRWQQGPGQQIRVRMGATQGIFISFAVSYTKKSKE